MRIGAARFRGGQGHLLRAADLAKFGFRYENAKAYETFTKARHFDDPELFKSVIEPKLQRFAAYSP